MNGTQIDRPETTLWSELRAATQPSHTRLEELPISKRVAEGTCTREEYAQWLAALWGVWEPAECSLSGHPLWDVLGFEENSRMRALWVPLDLMSLGWTTRRICHNPKADLAPPFTVEAALGRLYVLEGSALGAQVLSRALTENLGLSKENGLRYLTSRGDRTGAMWKEFRERMAEVADQGMDRAKIVEEAVNTFEAFEGWMRRSETF